MGNSNSTEEFVNNEDAVKTYASFTKQDNGTSTLTMESFLAKFPPNLLHMSEYLWKVYAREQEMGLHEYKLLLSDLAYEKHKPRFFIDLLGQDQFNSEDISRLFHWFSLGLGIGDELLNAIFKSMLSYSETKSSITKYELLSWLSRNFPDLGDDLAKLANYVLTHGEPIPSSFDCLNNFQTALLNNHIAWLLSFILPSVYKRPGNTILQNVAPFELEQLSHLVCLYDSSVNGLSATRVRELTFDYDGPVIILLRSEDRFFCLAIDEGLKESWRTFGGPDSCLFQFLPNFAKLVSGSSSALKSTGTETGVIYANFTSKTAKRGLLVGHQPLAATVLEICEGFDRIRVTGGQPIRLVAAEIWAAGSTSQLTKLKEQKVWDQKEVAKAKNRKIKLDEGWENSPDRHLLTLAGVNVRHSDAIEPHESEISGGLHNILKHEDT